VLLALFALLAADLSLAPGAAAGGGPAARTDVDQAVSFRGRMGFRSDPAFVATTFADGHFRLGKWGVPLDPAESAEVDRRAEVQRGSGKALRAAAKEGGAAGAYFDQAAGGAPVFLTSGDVGRLRAAVRGKLPAGVAARFERVRFSTVDLEALQSRVNRDLEAGRLVDLGVTSTAIDARGNSVVVGVAVASDQVRAALAARFGAGLAVVAEAPSQGGDAGCASRKSCPPAKGGIQIDSTYNGFACTIGFMVRVAGDNEPRLLTAGHCVTKTGGTGTSRKWRHDGVDYGWSEISTWTSGSDADAGIINPTSAAISGARNLAYAASSSDIQSITGFKATAEQIQGSLLCRAGAISNYVCGTVELTNRTKDVDGRTIDHQWVVDFDACPGDSGAPYLVGGTAWGIHTDSTTGCEPGKNQAWYSPIGWVLDVLAAAGHPVSLCTEASCGSSVNTWTARGSLDGAVSNPRVLPLEDGRVLALAGGDSIAAAGGAEAGNPEIYDAAASAWSDTASPPWLPDRCVDQAAVRLESGDVLVAGGSADGAIDDCSDLASTYDPTAGNDGDWAGAADLPAAMSAAAGILLDDGRALVVGVGEGGAPVAAAYSPATDTWAARAAPPSIGTQPVLARLGNGRVVLAGTTNEAGHVYDPAANTWATTTAIGGPGTAATSLRDGRVVVAGGIHDSGGITLTTKVSVFTPSTGKWTTLAALRAGRAGFALNELGDGRLLVTGGLLAATNDPDGAPTKSADVYDWSRNAWYAAPNMLDARSALGSVVLDDGSVLAVGGGLASTETYIPGDVIPPVAYAPAARLRSGTTMSSTSVPITVSWSAATDLGGAGTGTYEVARSTDGGAYSTISTSHVGTSLDTTIAPSHTYRFRVRARDWAGNFSAWKVASSTIRAGVTQQTSSKITWSGSWSTGSSSSFLGGSVRYSKSAGAKSSYLFTGRGITFVTEKGPARGSAKIYIDGTLATTVSMHASSTTYRYVAYQKSWSSTGQHRITVVVSGTSGHPRVDIDAFIVQTAP
jgi:hypothetical protein